jgi:hypothetical protein
MTAGAGCGYGRPMIACVLGIGASLLYLAPVLVMVGAVMISRLFAIKRHDEGAGPATVPVLAEIDALPGAGREPAAAHR